MNQHYTCKKCQWIGTEQELDYDITETCFGSEKIEMCPICGSYEVVQKMPSDK